MSGGFDSKRSVKSKWWKRESYDASRGSRNKFVDLTPAYQDYGQRQRHGTAAIVCWKFMVAQHC